MFFALTWLPFESAHPRSRGEHWRRRARSLASCGSSPLARGTSRRLPFFLGRRRLIPARAGNMSTGSSGRWARPAHPRSRGEHTFIRTGDLLQNGSSPLARGTYYPGCAGPRTCRLIPARAGNMRSHWRWQSTMSAHPRSRGEHASSENWSVASSGSSPLARGTCRQESPRLRAGRLIPARAGNMNGRRSFRPGKTAHPRSRGEHLAPSSTPDTASGSSPLARGTSNISAWVRFQVLAHPRSRGEHLTVLSASVVCPGSSPLARGTLSLRDLSHRGERLIPARAGNIVHRGHRSPRHSAHPRSRGEHTMGAEEFNRERGSSPLARGTFPFSLGVLYGFRLIPARAGNISQPRIGSFCRSAHPRSRGEHSFQPLNVEGSRGSSPLARGTSAISWVSNKSNRLIPARAGNIAGIECYTTNTTAHPRSRGEHARCTPLPFQPIGSSPLARGT